MSNNKRKIYLVMFLVVLFLFLVVAGLYIFAVYKKNIINYRFKKADSKQVFTEPKSIHSDNIKSPSPTISPTSRPQAKLVVEEKDKQFGVQDWQSYKSDNCGFSFQYPKSSQIDDYSLQDKNECKYVVKLPIKNSAPFTIDINQVQKGFISGNGITVSVGNIDNYIFAISKTSLEHPDLDKMQIVDKSIGNKAGKQYLTGTTKFNNFIFDGQNVIYNVSWYKDRGKDYIEIINHIIDSIIDMPNKPKYEFMVIKDKRVRIGDEFIISSDKRCTSKIKASISDVSEDTISLHQYKFLSNIGGIKWVDIPPKDRNLEIKNGDCISARGLCTGGRGYKYCFNLNKADNIYNINYQAKFFPNPNSPYNNPPAN